MTLAALTFTITMGWWILPAIITAILIGVVVYTAINDTQGWFAGAATIFVFAFAFGLSSFSWLIWSLFCR